MKLTLNSDAANLARLKDRPEYALTSAVRHKIQKQHMAALRQALNSSIDQLQITEAEKRLIKNSMIIEPEGERALKLRFTHPLALKLEYGTKQTEAHGWIAKTIAANRALTIPAQ
ncbi:MAG: hypothetical protein DHS20C08_02880 [Rhodomicrobium sp.]|nr:MAG: hypothetical protein DHS20C08_02880 [Rhodomicrobium sp.]